MCGEGGKTLEEEFGASAAPLSTGGAGNGSWKCAKPGCSPPFLPHPGHGCKFGQIPNSLRVPRAPLAGIGAGIGAGRSRRRHTGHSQPRGRAGTAPAPQLRARPGPGSTTREFWFLPKFRGLDAPGGWQGQGQEQGRGHSVPVPGQGHQGRGQLVLGGEPQFQAGLGR